MITIKGTWCRVCENCQMSLYHLHDFYVNLKLDTDKCIKILENKGLFIFTV